MLATPDGGCLGNMKIQFLILILSTLSVFAQGNQKPVITFDTVADMVARGNPRNPAANVVEVLGYYAKYDGGGGQFTGTNTVTSTNLGTRIDSPVPSWSWERIRTPNEINLKWFGAKSSGVDDIYVHYSSALSVFVSQGGGVFIIPPGGYLIDRYRITGGGSANGITNFVYSNLTNVRIVGDGATFHVKGDFNRSADHTVVFSYRTQVVPFWFQNCTNVIIEGIEINGNVDQMTRDVGVVEEGDSAGIVWEGGEGFAVRNVYVHHWATDGLFLDQLERYVPKNVLIQNSRFRYNARQGISVVGGARVVIENCDLSFTGQSSGVYGFHAPGAGIDIEPFFGVGFETLEYTRNIYLLNNRYIENKGNQIVVMQGDRVQDVLVEGGFVSSTNSVSNFTAEFGGKKVTVRNVSFRTGDKPIRPYITSYKGSFTEFEKCDFRGNYIFSSLSGNPEWRWSVSDSEFYGTMVADMGTTTWMINIQQGYGSQFNWNRIYVPKEAHDGATLHNILRMEKMEEMNGNIFTTDLSDESLWFTFSQTGTRGFFGNILHDTSGYDSRTAWTTTTYAVGQYVSNAGRVYRSYAVGFGNAADAPVHVSGSVTGADGYEWQLVTGGTRWGSAVTASNPYLTAYPHLIVPQRIGESSFVERFAVGTNYVAQDASMLVVASGGILERYEKSTGIDVWELHKTDVGLGKTSLGWYNRTDAAYRFTLNDDGTAGFGGNVYIAGSIALDSNDGGAFANGDGDDTAEIQAALNAAGENTKIVLHPKTGNYVISAALKFKNGQIIEGWGGNGQFNTSDTNQVTIRMTGSATNAIFEPYNTSSDTVNVQIRNLKLQGNGSTLVGVSFYRTSYSVIENCLITDCDIGLEIDANTSNQAYFNEVRNSKIAYNDVVNIRLQRGANANRFYNVWLGGTDRSVEVLSPSSNNEFHACNFQGVSSAGDGTDIHLYSDYGSTYVYGGWVEACGTAFHETTNGTVNIFGATIGGNVTNIVSVNSVAPEGLKFFKRPNAAGTDIGTIAQIGPMWITNFSTSAAASMIFNIVARNATNTLDYAWGYGSSTTATLNQSSFYNGTNGTAFVNHKTGSFMGNDEDSEIGLWTVGIKQGTGSPEGVVTAEVGTIYLRRDGGAGTTFYVKESGSGNTGWDDK